MRLNYKFKPKLVGKISYVTHKGKKRNFERPFHAHAPYAHELIYVDYGEIAITINEQNFNLKAGEWVFIAGGVKHAFHGKEDAPFDFLNIIFYGKIPDILFSTKLLADRKSLNLMERLKQESIQELPYHEEVMASCLTEFIAYSLRQVSNSIPARLPGAPIRQRYQSEIVNRAINVIMNEYSNQLTLQRLGKAVGVSESHLRRLLKIETGENFSSLLHKQRIAVAKHLLSESNYNLDEISTLIGYRSSSFFFRIFKRLTGTTPKAYSMSLGEPDETQ